MLSCVPPSSFTASLRVSVTRSARFLDNLPKIWPSKSSITGARPPPNIAVTRELTGECSLLEKEGSPLERIKRYLLLPRPGTRGCRVGRMTQDPQVVVDAELITIVADAFDTMLGYWEEVIAAAIAAGELPASIVAAELARTLAAVLQGGYVLARAKGEQGPMDAAIRGAVSLLDAARAAVCTEH